MLQAGAYNNPVDAERMKAKLAMAGFEPNVQKISFQGQGDFYRVRVGPLSEHGDDGERKSSAGETQHKSPSIEGFQTALTSKRLGSRQNPPGDRCRDSLLCLAADVNADMPAVKCELTVIITADVVCERFRC